MRSILALIFLVGIASVATAEEGGASGWYAGFGIGEVMVSEQQAGLSFEGEDTAWQMLMGYRLTPHVAVEGGYLSGGEADDVVAGIPVSVKSDAFFGSVVGTLPVSDIFGIHGRVGMLRWDADVSVPGASSSGNGTDLLWGGGMSIRARNTLFRFDYQRADIEVTDAEFLMLSVMILI